MRSLRTPARLVLLFLSLFSLRAHAEDLKGIVLDGVSLRPIQNARASFGDATKVSDANGRFSFTGVPPGVHTVRVTAPNFEPTMRQVRVPMAKDEVFVLFRPGEAGETVEVTSRAPTVVKPPGQQELSRKELTRIPGTQGDAVRAIKSLPGVANVDAPGAGPGQLVIRGAAPEDSKYIIDGIEVPLVYHFFGIQSILPSEFIDTIDFVPGGFGVDEGRATGGIVHIKTRSQQVEKLEGFAELSFINLALLAQGPISKKQGIYFSAGIRRSLVDFILPAVIPEDSGVSFTAAPRYWDGQLRLDYFADDNHHLSFFGIGSSDLLTLLNDGVVPNEPLLTNKFENETNFTRGIATWNYENGAVRNRFVVAGGTQLFRVDIGAGDRFLKVDVNRLEARNDFAWTPSRYVGIRAGVDGRIANGHIDAIIPLPPQEGQGQQFNFSTAEPWILDDDVDAHVAGAYLSADIRPTPHTIITPGIRFDYFNRISATTLSPRLSIKHRFDDRLTVRGIFGEYSRPLQQNEALAEYLEPELATQYVVGADYKLNKGLEASVSGFYTDRRQLVVLDANEAARDIDMAYVSRGTGRSFGGELMLRARFDNFFGWLSYTLSRSDRIDGPMQDRRLFDFDQTHVVVALGSYTYGKWEFGGRFQYNTGNPTTPIQGSIYNSDFNAYLPVLGDLNSDRIAAHHQLDVRIDRRWKFANWQLSAFLDISNVYANGQILEYQYNFDFTERIEITNVPILPAIGIRGTF